MVLATELTGELIREGIAKDLIRTIQNLRKEIGCQYTDRIAVGIVGRSPEVGQAVVENRDLIAGETLSDEIVDIALEDGGRSETEEAVVTVIRRGESA